MDTAFMARYLALFHSNCLSTLLFSRLLKEFGNIAEISALGDEELLAAGFDSEAVAVILGRVIQADTQARIEKDLEWQTVTGQSILCYESAEYPSLLREIDHAPPVLYVVGSPHALSTGQIAIVGSRKASSYGSQNAYWIAHELGNAGLTICSGLARGIDSKAHEGALDISSPTVAVLGTGADLRYPSCNQALAEKITESGALVSEFALGTEPMPYNFPRRNRIISGMSLGTLVVEATCNSGSLITARLALEQNRDVFAIPGSISSQSSRGTHRLIKEGAKLVESPIDILDELGWNHGANDEDNAGMACSPHPGKAGAAKEQAKSQIILDAMGYQSCLLQTLVTRTGLDFKQISSQLLRLEIDGRVENNGGRYSRLK